MTCRRCGGEDCQTYSAILEIQVIEGVEKTKSLGLSASPLVFSVGTGRSKSKTQSVLVKNIIAQKPAAITLLHPIGGFLFIYFVLSSMLLNHSAKLIGLHYEIDTISISFAFVMSSFLTALTTYYLWSHIVEQAAKSQNEFRNWENTWHCNGCSHRW